MSSSLNKLPINAKKTGFSPKGVIVIKVFGLMVRSWPLTKLETA